MTSPPLPRAHRAFLLRLHRLAFHYFLDNQSSSGLVRDRQRNRGRPCTAGLCSTAATGMGLIALSLAASAPHFLLSRSEAVTRIRLALETACDHLPHTHGVLPHFTDAITGAVVGWDARSTIDTGWLVAGGLWAAAYLADPTLDRLAHQLFDRIDWARWTAPDGLLRHAEDARGRFLPATWDRLNGETVFLYVLAAGADHSRAWNPASWPAVAEFPGTAAGLRFASADLGLFVFQYGLDLLDLAHWREPRGIDLDTAATQAALANFLVCRAAGDRFATYRHYWGLSAGDGPGPTPGTGTYRAYSPAEPLDGTAHLTAALASVGRQPGLVLEQLQAAAADRRLHALGRYGFSCVNLDRGWTGKDMVGIDAGAAVLALDNYLENNRVRRVFARLPAVRRGLTRIGFTRSKGMAWSGRGGSDCRSLLAG